MADGEDEGMSELDIWSVLYDVQEQINQSASQTPIEYEYPPGFEFISPHMEIRNCERKGRGYFATSDLLAGTLLIVERPLVHIYDADILDGHPEIYGATTAILSLQLLQLLVQSADLSRSISELHPSSADFDPEKHNIEIESDVLAHSLKTALESCDDSAVPSELKKRLSAIVRYNQVGFYTNNEQLCYQTKYSHTSGTGLYVKASAFNHDCRPNVVYYTIDNVLIALVSREVKANDELCISYIESSSLADSALFRNVHIDRDFICGCPKCDVELQNHDIKLIKDPNAVDPRMGEVLSEGIMAELWKMDAFERMTFAAEIKEAEASNFKRKDHIEYSMLMAISYEQCVLWEKSYWFWEASITACCGIDDHDELVKYLHAALASLALSNQKRFRHYLRLFLEKHDRYCGGGYKLLRLRYDHEVRLHPLGPKLKNLFWKFSEKLYPSRI